MNRFLLSVLFFVVGQSSFAQTWVRQNGPTGGEVSDIEFDVTNSKVYAVVDNHLFISTDDGVSWARVTGTLANYFIRDVEIGGGTIYVTDGYDVFTSTDGATFTKKNNDFVLSSVDKIERYGTSSLVAVSTSRVYYSTNGGTSWSQGAAPSAGSWVVNSLAVNSVDQIFLTNTSTNLPLRSTDGGISFSSPNNLVVAIPLVGPVHYMTSNNDKSLIYIITALDVYSSSNGGNNWVSVKGGITGLTISTSVSVPSLLEFSADGLGMYFMDNTNFRMWTKTLAAGSWTLSSAFPGTNQVVSSVSAKTYASAGTSIAAFGTNPGVYKTTNGGSVISESNTGLNGVSPFQFVHASNGNMLLNAYDLGLYQSTNSGDAWVRQTNIPANVAWLSATSTSATTGLNHVQLALLGYSAFTFYSSTNGGTNWTSQTTPAQLYWMQGTDFDRVFALSYADQKTLYYSYSNGATGTWSTGITISGLPTNYVVYSPERMSVYSTSATSATMFLELYNVNVSAYEQYRITFTIGATTTISGTATKITTIPAAIVNNIDKMMAVNGKFYVFTDNTNPDQYAYSSNGGSSWTTRTSPASEGNLFVARNGYVFLTGESPKKLYMSRDDGLNFIETTIPTTVDPFNINNIYIDLYDYGTIVSDQQFVHRTSAIIVTPLAPSNATILGKTGNAISIRWDDNATNEDQYNIERSSDGGATYSLVGSVDGSDICDNVAPFQGYYVDGGLSASTAYIYRVSAVNDAGSSSTLTFASTTTLAGSVANIPDNRSWTATNAGGNGYTATSLSPIGIRSLGGNKYEVSDLGMRLFSGSDYKDTFYESNGITLVAPTNTSFNATNNGTGTWNGSNVLTLKWKHCSSGNFETVTFTLNSLASDPTPAAPTGVQALVTGTSQIDISWTTGFYEKDYIVERSPNGTTSFVQVGTNVNYPTAKITDNSALVEGTTYYYRVRSRNANNVSSANSSVISIVYKKPYFILPSNAINNTSLMTLGSYWADYDNDGNEDVLFMKDPFSSYGVPVIYESDGAGNFTAHQVAVSTEKYFVPSVADFNNDGFPDLAMSIDEKAQLDLYYGNGDFTFTKLNTGQLGDIATSITGGLLSSSWADINNDGRLDLIALPQESGSPYLFKQTAGGSFVKISGGDLASDACGCIASLFADYNADGFSDLLIISQAGAWRLYQNNQNETFTDRTAFAGIDAAQGVTASWGDFNSDGLIDLYAGITSAVQPLYKNNGNGTFTKDVSSAVSESTTNFGSAVGDFNNDGLLDLIATGLSSFPTKFFINTSTGSTPTFTKVTNEKINDLSFSHYGAASGDYDNDGYQDLILSSFYLTSGNPVAAPGNAFKNNRNLSNTGNWLRVKVVGVNQNRSGIGAQILVTAGGKTQVREVFSLSSFASQNSLIQHFGLGNAATITSVQVRWPSGALQTLNNPAINQLLVITEDVTAPGTSVLSPSHNATGVNANATIEITLNESTTAVGGKNLVVTTVSGGATFANLPVTGATKTGNKYAFTMPSNFAPSTQYEVTVNSGAFLDSYSNAFAGIAAGAWRFTTAAGPQIVSLTPANAATAISGSTTLSIDFDVATTAVSGKKLFLFRTADLVNPVGSLDASAAVPSGNKQTFTLPAPIQQQTNFTVVVEAGAFKDVNQNIFAGITSGSWTFTTAAGPQVTGLTPTNNATGISGSTTLLVDFNVPTAPVAGKKLHVFASTDLTTPVMSVDVSGSTISGNRRTFTLPSPLAAETTYKVAIEANSFKDSNDNYFGGLPQTAWTFTTVPGPKLSALSPVHSTTGVASNAQLAITLDKPVTPVVGKKIRVFKTGVATAVFEAEVNAAGSGISTTFTYALSPKLETQTTYNVVVEASSFTDDNGNFFAGVASGSWSFTTDSGPTPTSFVPAAGAQNILSNAPLEVTFNRNITAVPGKKLTVLNGVELVHEAFVSATGTVSTNKYTLAAPSSGWPFQALLVVHLESGAFVDDNQNDAAAITGSTWSFTTVEAPDATAPSINPAGLPSSVEKSSLPNTVQVGITDNKAVTSAKLFFRQISGASFSEVNGTPPSTGSGWSFSIDPVTAFDANGMQYYFTAVDAANNSVRSPATGYHVALVKYSGALNAQVPQNMIGTGGKKEDWKVISVPFQLANNSVTSVFEELASNSSLTPKKDWRMLILKQTPAPGGSWGDFPEDFSTIQRGVGYFINVKNASPNLIIGDNLQAPNNTRDNLFTMELKAGWNMIGNPYLTAIDWSNVVALNSLTGTATVFKKFSAGAYSNTGALAPYEGGFVQVPANVTVSIPFLGQTVPGGRHKEVVFGEGDWVLPITLKQDEIVNTFGGVGMHKGAHDYFDELDDTNGPRFFDYVEMRLERPEHFPYVFARDVVTTTDEHMWDFTIAASGSSNVDMTWDPAMVASKDEELLLWDIDNNMLTNLKEVNSYTFDPAVSKRFRIFFGTDVRTKVRPEADWLGQPYPNPTNGISYIPFAITGENAEYNVQIEILDLMGRQVSTVVNGTYSAGLYSTQWSGDQASNGLYIVRMTVTGGSTKEVYSSKIVLNK